MVGRERQRLVELRLRAGRVARHPSQAGAAEIGEHGRARRRVRRSLSSWRSSTLLRLVPVALRRQSTAPARAAPRRSSDPLRAPPRSRCARARAARAARGRRGPRRAAPRRAPGRAAQRAGLAHARLGVALEVVLLEVEPRQRRERRRVLGRGLERRLDLLAGRLGVVEVVELQQRQLEGQLGDALLALPARCREARSISMRCASTRAASWARPARRRLRSMTAMSSSSRTASSPSSRRRRRRPRGCRACPRGCGRAGAPARCARRRVAMRGAPRQRSPAGRRSGRAPRSGDRAPPAPRASSGVCARMASYASMARSGWPELLLVDERDAQAQRARLRRRWSARRGAAGSRRPWPTCRRASTGARARRGRRASRRAPRAARRRRARSSADLGDEALERVDRPRRAVSSRSS